MSDVTLIRHPAWGVVSEEFIRTLSLARLTPDEERTLAWVFRNGEDGLPEEARPLLAAAREKTAAIAHWLLDALHTTAEDLFVGCMNANRSKEGATRRSEGTDALRRGRARRRCLSRRPRRAHAPLRLT